MLGSVPGVSTRSCTGWVLLPSVGGEGGVVRSGLGPEGSFWETGLRDFD